MSYNLKNVRNGKSLLKTSKQPSLQPLALKNEILWRFKQKKLLESKTLLSSIIFPDELLTFPKIQTDVQIHS